MTKRKYNYKRRTLSVPLFDEDGFSYILCHSCGNKKDADISAGYIIATRCRDDRLKAGMSTVKNGVSL